MVEKLPSAERDLAEDGQEHDRRLRPQDSAVHTGLQGAGRQLHQAAANFVEGLLNWEGGRVAMHGPPD